MKIKIFTLLLLFLSGIHFIVQGQCLETDSYFPSGEYVHYEVAYNWGFLWVDAGEVYFKADTLIKNNEIYYQFISSGQTYPFYDWFFKVRDRYESIVKKDGFTPVNFQRSSSEGGTQVNNQYKYSPKEKKVYMSLSSSEKPSRNDSLNLTSCAFDVLSAIYYTRSLDFSGFAKDSIQTIRSIIDGQIYELNIRYRGKDTIRSRADKSYACIHFTTQLVAGTIFKEGEELSVWVSDDENKIPILVEARVLVGSVKAYLKQYRNLKTPLVNIPEKD